MSQPERLDSWKAIANYLGRDVSTVRRWEKSEGLPVHRHLHKKLGSIYAFPSELDEWRTSRKAVKTTADTTVHDERTDWRSFVPSLMTLTVVITGLLYGLSGVRRAAVSTDAIDSIAVIPFANPGRNTSDDDMFVDTLSEGITSGLAAVPGLKVISAVSTARYKGKQIVPERVGRELGGVDALLVGRIRRNGDRIILSVELVDVRDGREVWGSAYKSGDVSSNKFFHQVIVGDVVQALTGRAHTTSYTRYVGNAEVYELWLRGRHHWYKRTPEGFARAIQAFSRAIEQDPTFAPAYAGLADTYTVMSYFSQLMPFEEARSKARAAAVKALALDDSLAEAHTSMASVLEFEQWDWDGAEREYRRAIQLAPNYATAHHWYANNLSTRGRHEEAIAHARRAVELDPLSPILQVALAHAYVLAGQNDDALGALSKALEIEPASANAHLFRGMVYSRQARYDEALVEMQIANRQFENWVWKAFLADLYTRMDRPDDAQRIVQAFETRRPGVSRLTAAAIYAAVGERQRPLALLRSACDARDPDITFLTSVPAFDRLRADPEFQALLRKTGLA